MSLTKEQICIYIIFLILIIIIVLKYNYNYVYDYYANLEPFTTTQDQQSAIDAIDIMSKLLFNKYNNLNIPINIANNNAICDVWGAKNIENANNNNCIKLPNSNDMQCLNNNSITSCSNYYQDGVINNYNDNSANIELLKTAVKTYVVNNTLSTVNDLEAKNNDITIILNNLIAKRNLENQQTNFLKYNTNNIDDKNKQLIKSSDEFEKLENKININNANFSQTISNNTNIDNKKNTYYNIIIVLIVLLIIIGVLNILFSNM